MYAAFRWSAPLALACICAPLGRAQTPDTTRPTPARVALARRVLDAGGTVETMLAAMRASLPTQQRANPQIPAEFWTRFEARITHDAPQLVDSIAVIYARRFTQDELQALLAFYQSPVGRRLRALQPTLIAEASAVGQRWGMRVGAEVGASLQKPQ